MARNQGIWLTGRLAKDAAYKMAGQSPNCTFTVAVERDKRQGQEKAQVDYPNITTWRGLADKCQNLKKGDTVMVLGTIQTRSYEGRNGKVYVTEVCGDKVFIDGGTQKKSQSRQQDDIFGEEESDFTPLDEDDPDSLPF